MKEKILLNFDHSMIVKFDNKNNWKYINARDKFKQFKQNASSVIAIRFCT